MEFDTLAEFDVQPNKVGTYQNDKSNSVGKNCQPLHHNEIAAILEVYWTYLFRVIYQNSQNTENRKRT